MTLKSKETTTLTFLFYLIRYEFSKLQQLNNDRSSGNGRHGHLLNALRGGDHDPHTLLCMTRGKTQRIWLHSSFPCMGTPIWLRLSTSYTSPRSSGFLIIIQRHIHFLDYIYACICIFWKTLEPKLPAEINKTTSKRVVKQMELRVFAIL